jgi:hypothetical protein
MSLTSFPTTRQLPRRMVRVIKARNTSPPLIPPVLGVCSLPKAERDITLSTFVPQDIRDRLTVAFSPSTNAIRCTVHILLGENDVLVRIQVLMIFASVSRYCFQKIFFSKVHSHRERRVIPEIITHCRLFSRMTIFLAN